MYDTLDHQIGGVPQQQSVGGSITFTSQYGTVSVTDLPVISVNGNPHTAPAPAHPRGHGPSQAPGTGARQVSPQEADIFSAIERLAELRGRGILSDEEFAAKKAELLGRL